MSRLFWLGVGVAAGVAITRKVSGVARQATPAGVAANVSDALRELAEAVGAFGADVRVGMAERERELYQVVEHQTGIAPGARPALDQGADRWGYGADSQTPARLPRNAAAGRGARARARRADG
ncbi:hypothetical protein [Goodfellowiella coeruleoviolacea]|uniref:Secreted protein n=1 Tax=Goodfellowiella coeruleoviolacea TaxID=334858 RepID=A0AAE3KHA6_9PSEU|nr:hypothetical protein [Goodfellowiella coeruleoviolacea]MCP2166657.1 hypothetical protein [Goodfellowiella coeruleoviolacea]